ncbi:hypothetical protein IEE94_06865 [Yimella sp. cx-573]|nr:hypothetical protein [Yimella sp. cx-573]
MDEVLAALVDDLRARQAAQVDRRQVVTFAPVLASATPRVNLYRELGATSQLVVTFGDGTGALPAEEDADVLRLEYPGEVRNATDELKAWQQVVTSPPPQVLDALTRFDPSGEALVVIGVPVATPARIFGRETINGRSFADQALEDKTLCGDIFRAAGLDVAEEEVVPADPIQLQRSALRLDRGNGVVISADASQGLNGGASKVWWVRPGEDPAPVFDEVSKAGAQARLMPFLDGQPCSIHGFVTDNGVIALRPVELCMLRRAGGPGFLQAGISTWWDPTDAARTQMREAARRVGEVLGRDHNYRGAFGIDGVLTRDGFRAHEINPRFSGGINTINKASGAVPLNLLDMALRSRDHITLHVAAVEDVLVAEADAHRYGSAYLTSASVRPTESTSVMVTGSSTQLSVARDEASSVGTLELGPAAMGGLVRFTPTGFSPGERLTSWCLAIYRLADELWDTGFGDLEAPPEYR